jgi:hypothetical protein
MGVRMNQWDRRLTCCLLVFALLLSLCGCAPGDDQGSLFQDDFGDRRSGWGEDQRETFERGYEDGKYVIKLHEPNWFAWAYPGERFDDVSVDVDVRLVSGSQDSHFGVMCRHETLDNFYYFAISADGYYAIFRRVDGGDMESLTGDGNQMVPSAAIKTGEQDNHLLAVCQGDQLSLYANGQLLETVTDDTHARGDVGIGVGSGAAGDVRVQFDDLVVARP